MTIAAEPGPPHHPAEERKQREIQAGLSLPALLTGTTASVRLRGF